MPLPTQRKHTLPTWTAIALCASLGCSSTKPTPKSPHAAPPDRTTQSEAPPDDGLASVIATVPSGTLGPYIAYGPKGALAFFAPPSEKSGRHWLAQPIDEQGKPVGDPRDFGTAPDDVPFAVVRPIRKGYLALWVRQVNRADVLEGVVVDDHDPPRSIQTLRQARGRVVWANAFQTSKAAVVLWAEQSDDRAKLMSVSLDDEGKAIGNASTLVQDIRAWEAVGLDDGVAIALVVANETNPSLGSVALLRVDAAGSAVGKPIPISQDNDAQLDVGLVRTGRSLLIAWTERSHGDSIVKAATTDLTGRPMVAARAPLPSQGDQALVALVAPAADEPNQALVVYEEIPSRRSGPRQLRLARLSSEAMASERMVTLSYEPVGRPVAEVSTTQDGFVLLTRAPSCDDEGACGKEHLPWYVRLGSNLAIEGAAPLLVDALGRKPPSVVWGPGCTQSSCLTLAVGGQAPAHVATIKLPKGSIAPGVPAEPTAPSVLPMPLSNRAVHISADPISEIDATPVGATTFVAWVTHFVEAPGAPPRLPPPGAPGDPRKPMEALLAVQRLDASGARLDHPITVSVRAVSSGGVAIAPSAKGNEACMAWVGRDNGDPQVFVTRIGADGKKKLQRMVSRAKGNATDVAIARQGTGWVVAWVDWRDGNGEVYVTRLNALLVRLTPVKRITHAPGDASDVSLAIVDGTVLVAYGDSRDQPELGTANPYVQALRTTNLERIGEERRIEASALHARDVQLVRDGNEVFLSWVDEAPQGSANGSQGGPRVTRLDVQSLKTMGGIDDLGISGENLPISLRMTCKQDVCRGAMMVSTSDGMNLEGLSWTPGTSGVHRGRLARVTGPVAADVAPVTFGNDVFFVDQGLDGDNRLRHVQVRWER